MTAGILAGYQKRRFEAPIADGSRVCHDIYERGEGVPVIIMQEMPGMGLRPKSWWRFLRGLCFVRSSLPAQLTLAR